LDCSRRISGVEVLVLVDDYAGYESGFFSEHGFSALVSVRYDDGCLYRVLFDTGSTGEILLHNAKITGVELELIDAVILSHRHYDHTGGLAKLSKLIKGKPVIAHPDMLKPCYVAGEKVYRFNGGLTLLPVGF